MSQNVEASPRVPKLLDELQTKSERQEEYNFWIILYYHLKYAIFHFILRRSDVNVSSLMDEYARERFVALERDKSELVYLLARAQQARVIVEAGTSYGVSIMYLALAVGQNTKSAAGSIARSDLPRNIIETEKEPTKAAQARKHWSLAGDEVEPWIELREGDLLETLKENLREVDMLLLDIWTPLALPTLEIVKSKLRHGAIVIADNTDSSRRGYAKFLAYVQDPNNDFRAATAPYKGGLWVGAYLP